MRILDREIVEAELVLHLAQQLLARLVQADPDEVAGIAPAEDLADVGQVHVADAPPVGVLRAIDHLAVARANTFQDRVAVRVVGHEATP